MGKPMTMEAVARLGEKNRINAIREMPVETKIDYDFFLSEQERRRERKRVAARQ
jgi:hypothetical protein